MKRAVSIGLCLLGLAASAGPRPALQQDPPREDCCLDIFYTGYHLGMAYVMASRGYAVEELFTFMSNARRFVATAYQACSRLNPAWPDWRQKSQDLQQWADRLSRSPDAQTVLGAATYLDNARASWASSLQVQIVDGRPVRQATCEASYFLLGYDLAEAQGYSVLASSAEENYSRNGQIVRSQQGCDKARADLDNLKQIRPVTGSCASMAGLRERLGAWRANYDDPRVAAANQSLAGEVVAEVVARLERCVSTLGGSGIPAVPGLAQALGVWVLSFQEIEASTGRWGTLSSENIELFNRTAGSAYLATGGVLWRMEDGRLVLWADGDSSQRMIFRLQSNGAWLGAAVDAGGAPLRSDRRLVLTRPR